MKILNKLATVAIGATALFAACTPPAPTSYTVTGILPDSSMNGKEVFIRHGDATVIDSTTVDGNKFTFEGVADSAIYSYIHIRGTQMYSNLVLENGDIVLDFSAEEVIPTGTPNNKILGDIYAICDTIKPENYMAISAEWFAKHNNDIISIVLYNSCLYPIFNVDLQIATLEGMGENIKGYFNSELNRLKAEKATEVGRPYIDFEGKDAAGNPVKLSDYVGKGNYVLVDMWTSWISTCIDEIPHLAEVHNLYKDKGLTVLGIFVWDDVKNLEPTLKAEGVTWAQIIDTEKKAVEAYGANGPLRMLIGPDGTILERNINERGESMKPIIEKYLLKK